MSILTMCRPAQLLSDPVRLDSEYRSTRWIHHRLLDFEDEHQRVIDATAEEIAPGIGRVGRILARLYRREKRAERVKAGTWTPDPRRDLADRIKVLLAELRAVRNADPRWKEALGWAEEQIGGPKRVRRRRAKPAHAVKRHKKESDEAWAKRFALLTSDETDEHYAEKVKNESKQTRREVYRAKLYAERRIYWGTWNALRKSVDQACKDVLARRKQGLPADWNRPKFRNATSLAADKGFRILERGHLWWVVEMRIGTGKGSAAEWVRVRAKCGNWHKVPDDAVFKKATLTRRLDGQRWKYSLSLAVDGVRKPTIVSSASPRRTVGFDWGHREHGHDSARDGLRSFVWTGDDGRKGEILIPTECRQMLDEVDEIKKRLDDAFNARKATLELASRGRHGYRRQLLMSGVRNEEQAQWLRWETRYERRIARRRKRSQNLRHETYTLAIRDLLRSYAVFAFESDNNASIKKQQQDEHMRRRARANRDLTARYEFVELCEWLGATLITVSARNTTRECPECAHMDENTAELLMVCSGCGTARDKDFGAARVILRRAEAALATHAPG